MTSILDDYIDLYIVSESAGVTDKTVARHLKEIIPKTTHMDKNTFTEILKSLRKEMDNGKDFKSAFHEVCEKYVLSGDIIKAKLPTILIRIILSKKKIISYIKRESDTPYSEKEIEDVLSSEINKSIIDKLLGKVYLSKKMVVFSTFDERDRNGNPFLNHSVIDIINMLAMNKDIFEADEIYSAVKIRYQNSENFDKKYPTFIDAGWWDKFYPSKKDDDYGRTQSLDPLLPNMPEIVHENMIIADVMEEIEFLEDKNGINKTTGDR
ncbi:MAG: hypothetical protein GTO45_33805 [Candidatus Aminicenantes bacterium]|nr:hypothetical protein [Candidatus Aminicenantes bacterium]NIM83685.1 hypothetical protein [Candidatus Aminicenantes bacterium]NIN23110.1 hypothetical protein [Candidatus Aminicenantes bacterium]NIN46837.1 hypothetical protein [Candidatus Aminicenantes bacterium]NIN89759.1 hypothetical protein [Candidatus Aminicenantes bacterium]